MEKELYNEMFSRRALRIKINESHSPSYIRGTWSNSGHVLIRTIKNFSTLGLLWALCVLCIYPSSESDLLKLIWRFSLIASIGYINLFVVLECFNVLSANSISNFLWTTIIHQSICAILQSNPFSLSSHQNNLFSFFALHANWIRTCFSA